MLSALTVNPRDHSVVIESDAGIVEAVTVLEWLAVGTQVMVEDSIIFFRRNAQVIPIARFVERIEHCRVAAVVRPICPCEEACTCVWIELVPVLVIHRLDLVALFLTRGSKDRRPVRRVLKAHCT